MTGLIGRVCPKSPKAEAFISSGQRNRILGRAAVMRRCQERHLKHGNDSSCANQKYIDVTQKRLIPSLPRQNTPKSVHLLHWSKPNLAHCGVMRLPPTPVAPADPRRPESTARFWRSLRAPNPRVALKVLLATVRVSHQGLRSRDIASSRSGWARFGISSPALSYSLILPKQRVHRTRCPRSLLRTVSILPGKAAKAARSFFTDRCRSLWRPLLPRRRCADRERSGPP